MLDWLHIGVLELLATGFNAIVMAPFVCHERLVLLSDALATPYVLRYARQRSAMLMAAHHELLAEPLFECVARSASIGAISGDCNAFSDAISRAEWERLQLLAQVLGIKLTKVQVPNRLQLIVDRLVHVAQVRGVRVARSTYRPPEPVIPEVLMHLGTQ